ncbi:MAG: hypothetical protein AMXMBFR80_09310 [Dehalococcoidia bacterium]
MSDELRPGDLVGDYTLEQRLGGGGFGAVWRATQTSTGKTVALKVLRTDVYSADTVRLRSEVELLAATASSRSPHVVRVLDGGIDPTPYVVMEFIDGTDLGRELERRRRIPQLETIRIGRAVADALSALESVGIIHRDIKPANVMVDVDGVVKLTDFGIAKIVGFDSITATSQMPMSMAYAAPEAWEGQASHQSDLYSLGCLLFQCLAGRPPFTGSPAQLFREHTTKDPDWTLLPEGTVQSLRDLLRACLAKDPGGRPHDSASVAEQLTEAERELNARVLGSTDSNLPVHEPQAFGPWLRRENHPTHEWAFLCIHETTGEKATVEIHFADDIEYGARLRKAVEVNPKLVPLGAERLLGTNRLVLRPGEAWTEAPAGQFQFWVAREELPSRPGPEVVDQNMLFRVASGLVGIADAAASSGLRLRLPPAALSLFADGTVVVRRAGLWNEGDDWSEWLRALPLDGSARALVQSVTHMSELRVVEHGRGFARPADTSIFVESVDESAMVGGSIGRLTEPLPPASTAVDPAARPESIKEQTPSPGSDELERQGQEPRRRYWHYVAGTAAFFVAVPVTLGLVLWGLSDDNDGRMNVDATPTSALVHNATPTTTPSPTATATPTVTPTRTPTLPATATATQVGVTSIAVPTPTVADPWPPGSTPGFPSQFFNCSTADLSGTRISVECAYLASESDAQRGWVAVVRISTASGNFESDVTPALDAPGGRVGMPLEACGGPAIGPLSIMMRDAASGNSYWPHDIPLTKVWAECESD